MTNCMWTGTGDSTGCLFLYLPPCRPCKTNRHWVRCEDTRRLFSKGSRAWSTWRTMSKCLCWHIWSAEFALAQTSMCQACSITKQIIHAVMPPNLGISNAWADKNRFLVMRPSILRLWNATLKLTALKYQWMPIHIIYESVHIMCV